MELPRGGRAVTTDDEREALARPITDAQVDAALRGFLGPDGLDEHPASRPYWEPRMRAALEAARDAS
jgi:hypothetical protein